MFIKHCATEITNGVLLAGYVSCCREVTRRH